MSSGRSYVLRSVEQGELEETMFTHPLNPRSLVRMRSLGDAVGLSRLGVHVMRVPPGHESFVYHAHYTEEEFVFVLSGRGIAEVAGEKTEVGPGDFLGFPTSPPVAHHLYNPFDEDLVYLSAGERHETEVADFPKLGVRQVRVGMSFAIHRVEDALPFGPFPMVKAE
jgi:uncharacterized cupin superfamily protein